MSVCSTWRLFIWDGAALGFRSNVEGGEGEAWMGGRVNVMSLYYNSVCSQKDLNIISFFIAFITMEKSTSTVFFLFAFFVSLLWHKGETHAVYHLHIVMLFLSLLVLWKAFLVLDRVSWQEKLKLLQLDIFRFALHFVFSCIDANDQMHCSETFCALHQQLMFCVINRNKSHPPKGKHLT